MQPAGERHRSEITAARDTERARWSSIQIAPSTARRAADLIGAIHGVTPLLPIASVDRDGVKLRILGKFENVQAVYTFKARGAEFLVHHIAEQFHNRSGMYRERKGALKRGPPAFVTASAGNHAQGVTLAAKRHKFAIIVFMPEGAPAVKQERVKELGGEVRLVPGKFDDCLAAALRHTKSAPGLLFVPPYEHPDIMAGQASVGVEILRQSVAHPNYIRLARDFPFALEDHRLPHVVLCGLGGGGLSSGIGAVMQEFFAISNHKIRVIGVQSTAADSMYRSFKNGELSPSSDLEARTVADGIAVKQASPRMLATVKRYVDQVALVDEPRIHAAIKYLANHPHFMDRRWDTMEVGGNVPHRALPESADHVWRARRMDRIEGAGAAPLAAAISGDLYGEIDWRAIAAGRSELNVVCVLSGGNIPRDKWYEIAGRAPPTWGRPSRDSSGGTDAK